MIVHSTDFFREKRFYQSKNLDSLEYGLLERILSYLSVKDFWTANKVCKHISYQVKMTWPYYLANLVKKTSVCSEELLGRLLNEKPYMRRDALINYIHRKLTEPSPDIDKLINLIPKIEYPLDESDVYKHIAIYFIHNGNWPRAVEYTKKTFSHREIIGLILKKGEFENLKLHFYSLIDPGDVRLITDIALAQVVNNCYIDNELFGLFYPWEVIGALLKAGRVHEARCCLPEDVTLEDKNVALLKSNNHTVESFFKLEKVKLKLN